MAEQDRQTLGFGGGCHWCTEAVFQQLRGVDAVRQGFIRSEAPDDTWSEAVEVDFHPARSTVEDLLAIHLATHASTSDHKMRGKYRSAVYVTDTARLDAIAAIIDRLGAEVGTRFVTRVLPHRGFKATDPQFRDYYRTDPGRPFCRTYIDPKLAKLRRRFAPLLHQEDGPP